MQKHDMSFKEYYEKTIREKLAKEFELKNPLAVPKLEKVVVNVGVGEATSNRKVLETVAKQIEKITGQKPVFTKARRAISGFKVRKGMPIGVKVTLRGKRMYDFFEKLVKIVIPRIKDFRGIDLSCLDSSGNLNLGFTEQLIFPELEFDDIDRIRGLQVTVVVKGGDREKNKRLFEEFGIPFKSEK